MLNKIAKLNDNMYQVNECDIPIDITSARELIKSFGVEDINGFMDDLDSKGSIEFEEKFANRGVVVNMYEVDYSASRNSNNETQEMISHLDENTDFITQNLFPGSKVEDIIVELKNKREEDFDNVKRNQFSRKKSFWRQILDVK
jgi:hypothetical protein